MNNFNTPYNVDIKWLNVYHCLLNIYISLFLKAILKKNDILLKNADLQKINFTTWLGKTKVNILNIIQFYIKSIILCLYNLIDKSMFINYDHIIPFFKYNGSSKQFKFLYKGKNLEYQDILFIIQEVKVVNMKAFWEILNYCWLCSNKDIWTLNI